MKTVVLRCTVGLLGVAAIAYGVSLALEQSVPDLVSAAKWFGGGILVHDAVFAPLCIAVAFLGRRLLPRRWWGTIAVATLISVTLLVVVAPVLRRRGAMADNPTVLDRNYTLGVTVALGVVWGSAALFIAAREFVSRGRRLRSASSSIPS